VDIPLACTLKESTLRSYICEVDVEFEMSKLII
jgi:hypothetical protein